MQTTTVALLAATTIGAAIIGVYWLRSQSTPQAKPVALALVNGHTHADEHASNGTAVARKQVETGQAVPSAVAVADAGPVSEEAKRLSGLYKKMAEDFATGDLNAAAIQPLVGWFHGIDTKGETPWPKKYTELPDQPLNFGAVRLLVVPLDHSPDVLRIAAAVTADVMRLLPDHAKVFANARGNYHITVFHTSQPYDPRPDPTLPDGGVDASIEPSKRRVPTEEEWANELETMRKVVAATPVPLLRLERIVQANSGVLLITWTEVGEAAVLPDLRARCRAAFPGASTKQSTIIHSSLLRVVTPDPLGKESVAAIDAACERWTAKLRGKLYSPRTLWFIREVEFSTINGEREVLTLADDKAAPYKW